MLRTAIVPSNIDSAQVAAPRGIAPYSHALTASTTDEKSHGKFVVLHDPAGQSAWQGDTRLVAYISTPSLSPSMSSDRLARIVWHQFDAVLTACATGYAAAAGTVTRCHSTRFGELHHTGQPAEDIVELRVSWTPRDHRLGGHLNAWYRMLAAGNLTATDLEVKPAA